MQRVFVNLFNNAVDAMQDDGELSISLVRQNGKLLINVKDTGVGISEENLARVFTPLFTTKAKGQGFGLPVCKRIVEAHNGAIGLESEVGKGTTFRIELPEVLPAPV